MKKIIMIVSIAYTMMHSTTQASLFDRAGLALTGATCCLALPATIAVTALYCGVQSLVVTTPLAPIPQAFLCFSGGQLCYMAWSNHGNKEEREQIFDNSFSEKE